MNVRLTSPVEVCGALVVAGGAGGVAPGSVRVKVEGVGGNSSEKNLPRRIASTLCAGVAVAEGVIDGWELWSAEDASLSADVGTWRLETPGVGDEVWTRAATTVLSVATAGSPDMDDGDAVRLVSGGASFGAATTGAGSGIIDWAGAASM